MTTRDKAPTGAPCWVDLWSSDTKAARAFYSELFGWEAQEPSPEFGGYFMFTRNGVPVAGGMGDMRDAKANNTWKVYLATDDAAKTVEVAEAQGAQVVVKAEAVADLGAQAVLLDPTGASVGVWEPRAFPGLTVLTEHGAPSWFELITRDYAKAVAFYQFVFHWDTHVVSDTETFRYTTLVDPNGGSWLAGIMDGPAVLPPGHLGQWSVYFGADDADAVAAKAKRHGGYVLREPEDTPYGRLAELADPMGARFKLVAANEAMPAK